MTQTPRLTSCMPAQAVAGLVLAASALLACWAYGLAAGLTWQFDDWINLKGLAQADTYLGAVNFVFGGIAGPGGRPVALATFLADYGHWPRNPWGVVQHTLVWHLMSGAAIFLFLRPVLDQLQTSPSRALGMAAATAGIWLLLPIHASGVLMPVQRMTEVSGFFVFATLATYAQLRLRAGNYPGWRSLGALVLACGLGTLLAVFSKENGVLLLCFIPLVEWFFFGHLSAPCAPALWRWALRVAFAAVPVLLVGYVLYAWDAIQATLTYLRDFSMEQRLASEAVILIEYLRQIFLPRPAQLGPYHDGYAPYNWQQAVPWVSVLFGILVIVTLYRWSRKEPRLGRIGLFAVLFFGVAHLLESTFIPLELYFEHRNYVAALGLVLFVVALCENLMRRIKLPSIAVGLLLLFAGYQLFALAQVTSLWGKPLLAGLLWYKSQPDSTRAVQYLAWQLEMQGKEAKAASLLDEFAGDNPSRTDVALQSLAAACVLEDAPQLQQRMVRLEKNIPLMRKPSGVVTSLQKLGDAMRNGKCKVFGVQDSQKILLALLHNAYVNGTPRVRHHVYHELAKNAELLGQPEQRIDYLAKAFHDFPSFSGAQIVAVAMFQHGENKAALEWIDSVILQAPNSATGAAWRSSLSSLRDAIQKVDAILSSEGLD